MSAYLDRSQGVTFVYSNIFKLYLKAKNAKLDDPMPVERIQVKNDKIIREADFLKQSQVKEFKARTFEVPMGVKEAEAKALLKRQDAPMEALKENMKGLKDAHAKLRFLLKEIEEAAKNKK